MQCSATNAYSLLINNDVLCSALLLTLTACWSIMMCCAVLTLTSALSAADWALVAQSEADGHRRLDQLGQRFRVKRSLGNRQSRPHVSLFLAPFSGYVRDFVPPFYTWDFGRNKKFFQITRKIAFWRTFRAMREKTNIDILSAFMCHFPHNIFNPPHVFNNIFNPPHVLNDHPFPPV